MILESPSLYQRSQWNSKLSQQYKTMVGRKALLLQPLLVFQCHILILVLESCLLMSGPRQTQCTFAPPPPRHFLEMKYGMSGSLLLLAQGGGPCLPLMRCTYALKAKGDLPGWSGLDLAMPQTGSPWCDHIPIFEFIF